jgi:hypothetical protein
MSVRLHFKVNKVHDRVGEALRTTNEGRVTVNSHALSFHPVLNVVFKKDVLQACTANVY